jgi:hypothetical protein
MKPTGDTGRDEQFVERVEALLVSLTSVVSARVVLDAKRGTHVHILTTTEMPVSEVSRAVMSALTWEPGFAVRADQITVVQSRLSRRELRGLLGLETPDPEPPAAPTPEPGVDQRRPDSDSELSELDLGESDGVEAPGPEQELQRLALRDLQVHKNADGGFDILVRLTSKDRSIGAQRDAEGTEEDSLEVPASAALGVIEEFLRSGREGEAHAEGAVPAGGGVPSRGTAPVILRFMAAKHVRRHGHDVVVVLVEADVGGRKVPLTGAASASRGIERASILATLQATNAFVAGTLTTEAANVALPPAPR